MEPGGGGQKQAILCGVNTIGRTDIGNSHKQTVLNQAALLRFGVVVCLVVQRFVDAQFRLEYFAAGELRVCIRTQTPMKLPDASVRFDLGGVARPQRHLVALVAHIYHRTTNVAAQLLVLFADHRHQQFEPIVIEQLGTAILFHLHAQITLRKGLTTHLHQPAAAALVALRFPHRLDLVLEQIVVAVPRQAGRKLNVIVQPVKTYLSNKNKSLTPRNPRPCRNWQPVSDNPPSLSSAYDRVCSTTASSGIAVDV